MSIQVNIYIYACFKLPPKSGQVFSALEISSLDVSRWYIYACVFQLVLIAKNSVQILINIRGIYSVFVNTRYYWINRSRIIVFMMHICTVTLLRWLKLRSHRLFVSILPSKCIQILHTYCYYFFCRRKKKEALTHPHDIFSLFEQTCQIDQIIKIVTCEMILYNVCESIQNASI